MSIYDTNVLFAVDITLEQFVSKIISNIKNISNPRISFNSPQDVESGANLGLFRYKIEENSFYKNLESKFNHPNRIEKPPLVVDVYYLLTAYGNHQQASEILTKILQGFNNTRTIAGSFLKEDLQKTGNTELKVILNSLKMDELNHLWSLFSGKPFKMSLSYKVTPVKIPSGVELGTKLVVEKDFSYQQGVLR